MMWWNFRVKRLLLFCILLTDVTHAQAPPPRFKSSLRLEIPTDSISPSLLPVMAIDQETQEKKNGKPEDKMSLEEDESSISSVHYLVSFLTASLQDHKPLHGNLSCADLASGPWRGAGFPQEFLGLVMVPVLVSARCIDEAQMLVKNLYTLLGQNDTQELLEDIVMLMKLGKENSLHTSHFLSNFPKLNPQSQHQLQGVMFNIQQLAEVDQVGQKQTRQCRGWLRLKGTQLLGQTASNGGKLQLSNAKRFCLKLGLDCAGLTREADSSFELYRVILRNGSRVVPSASPSQSESWIQRCEVGPARLRRHAAPQHSCINQKEERVHDVVEWIPGVSTLYNLGTAVYYASVNCSDTAKERAILSAVDLGTDALMAVTGGTAGVAGYALGAGLKTGVKAGIKYWLDNANQEPDLLMNQNSWEDGTLIIQ